jgi:hypothetical protein
LKPAIPILLLSGVLALAPACGGKGSSASVPPLTACTWTTDPGSVSLFAYQDGDGAWTEVQGDQGVYAFSLARPRGAVAAAIPPVDGAPATVVLFYDSAANLASRNYTTPPADLTVNGTYTGVAEAATALDIQLPNALDWMNNPGDSGTWSMSGLGHGSQDLLAVEQGADADPMALIIRRGLDLEPPSPVTAPVLDFSPNGPALAITQPFTLTVAPAGSNTLTLTESYQTAAGSAYLMNGRLSPEPFYQIPAASQQSGDRYDINLQFIPQGGDVSNGRTVDFFTAVPRDLTMAIQADMTQPVTTPQAGGPYLILSTQCTFDANYQAFTIDYSQGSTVDWRVVLPRSYGVDTVTLPDLSGLAGWQSAWGLSAASPVNVSILANGQDWSGTVPPEGAHTYMANHTATLVPNS